MINYKQLIGKNISTSATTYTIEDITQYNALVIQAMNSNITYNSITIFKDRYTNFGGTHIVLIVNDYIRVHFTSNTSFAAIANNDGYWCLIYGIY